MYRKAKQRQPRVYQNVDGGWFVRYKGQNYGFGGGADGQRSALRAVPRIYASYPAVLDFMGNKGPMPRLRGTPQAPTPPVRFRVAMDGNALATGRMATNTQF